MMGVTSKDELVEPIPEYTGKNHSLLDTKLLQVGAHMFIWIIGILAAIWLLRDYATVLKPLVLAALLVSILEWVVQTIEFLQWKGWVLLVLCLYKLKLLILLLMLKFKNGFFRCLGKASPNMHRRRQLGLIEDLRDWHRLALRWDPTFAGRNLLFRFTAVFWTLSIVAALVLCLSSLLVTNVEDFAHGERMHLYRQQLADFSSAADSELRQLPDHLGFFSNSTKDLWHGAVTEFESTFHMNNNFILENQKYLVEKLKEGVGSTSTVLTELAFFVLYTTIWLFAPLKINPDEEKERHAGTIYSIFKVWKRTSPSQCANIRSGHQVIDNVHLFYQAKSDPRQDLQERIYHIMQVYFSLKLLMNGLFAFFVWCLLHYLGVDLAGLLAVTCFCLNFIPEVGTIISILLPIPIILLMPIPSGGLGRAAILCRFVLGMAIIKLLISNILESYLMGHNSTLSGAVTDHEFENIKETHPVIILFFVVFAGEIWGPVGMLISVPLISSVRLMLNFWNMRPPKPIGNTDLEDSGLRFQAP